MLKKANKRVKNTRKKHGLGFGDKTRLTPYPSRYEDKKDLYENF